MIITILFAIVFTVLLAKAIIETIWGSILIIFGLACQILAFALRMLAKAILLWGRITAKTPKKPRRQMTIAECFVVVNNRNSPEAKRILASLR
jgi:protein-S-isoprenylcysteine O-methyltransferase Ste14